MDEALAQSGGQQLFLDIGTRLREMEERQQLLRDRTMLIGKSMLDIKERIMDELRETRKSMSILQKENSSLKEAIQLMSEKLNGSARQEEVETLKRQIDLLRGGK